jgi:hypothetical protein
MFEGPPFWVIGTAAAGNPPRVTHFGSKPGTIAAADDHGPGVIADLKV